MWVTGGSEKRATKVGNGVTFTDPQYWREQRTGLVPPAAQ
jgi:hypothetical protein